MVQLGRGDPFAALRTSPLVVLGAPLWVLWPRLRPALAARYDPARLRMVLVATLLTAVLLSQLWQLHRLL